ncbi:MAG: hypothetical protein IT350_07925 [Deltaproteobacteria bacterium]|nr:hypothetical protein [Deltaproteobacteria bacterium]
MSRSKRLFGPGRFLPPATAITLGSLLVFAVLSFAAWLLIVPKYDDAERRKIEADTMTQGAIVESEVSETRMLRAFETASLIAALDPGSPTAEPPPPAMIWQEGVARTFRVKKPASARRFHEAKSACETGLRELGPHDGRSATESFRSCAAILDGIARGREHDDRWPIFYNLGLAELRAGNVERATRELNRASGILLETPEDRESLRAQVATFHAVGVAGLAAQNGALAFEAWRNAATIADRLCGIYGRRAAADCVEVMQIGERFDFDPAWIWAGIAITAKRFADMRELDGDRAIALRTLDDVDRPIARMLRERYADRASPDAGDDGREFWVLWGYDRVMAFSSTDIGLANRAAADLVERVKSDSAGSGRSSPVMEALLTSKPFVSSDRSGVGELGGIFAALGCVSALERGAVCSESALAAAGGDFAERARWIELCRDRHGEVIRGVRIEDRGMNAIGQGRFAHFAGEWREAALLDIAAPMVREAGKYLDQGQTDEATALLDRASRIADISKLPEFDDVVKRLPADARLVREIASSGAGTIGRWVLFAVVAMGIAAAVRVVALNLLAASRTFNSLYRYEKSMKRRTN